MVTTAIKGPESITISVVPAKILFVDDDPVLNYAISRLLTAAGFSVIRARNGTEALQFSKTEAPLVAILDIRLPDISGFDLCAELKNNPVTAHIPIIFHTATSSTPENMARAKECGAAEFLTYPIDSDELVATVRRHMPEEPGNPPLGKRAKST
jgi:two-component system, sensor histidine kinase